MVILSSDIVKNESNNKNLCYINMSNTGFGEYK